MHTYYVSWFLLKQFCHLHLTKLNYLGTFSQMFYCVSLNWTVFKMCSRLCFFSLGEIRPYLLLCWQPLGPVSSQAVWIMLLPQECGSNSELVGFYGKTPHCCCSVQISVRTHCSVLIHHSSGVFQKSLKNKWVAAFAPLNLVVICPSITDYWFERSHLSQQGQYLDTTASFAESHSQMYPNHMKWVGFSLSHPTAGKLFRPHHSDSAADHHPVAHLSLHLAMSHSFPLTSTFYFNFFSFFSPLCCHPFLTE